MGIVALYDQADTEVLKRDQISDRIPLAPPQVTLGHGARSRDGPPHAVGVVRIPEQASVTGAASASSIVLCHLPRQVSKWHCSSDAAQTSAR